MALKQLKVSMIFGGAYHTFGTLVEEDELPPNLRKAKYLEEPGEGDPRFSEMEEIGQEELFEDELEISDEELPPTRIPTDSRAKYFKPKPKKK